MGQFDGGGHADFAEYPNVHRLIGTVISARLATAVELKTALSARDLYDLAEIIAVDTYNQRVALKAAKDEQDKR